MDIKRLRKHYKTGDPQQRQNIERLCKDEVDLASLIFDADIELMTFGDKKAFKTAEKLGVSSWKIGEKGIKHFGY